MAGTAYWNHLLEPAAGSIYRVLLLEPFPGSPKNENIKAPSIARLFVQHWKVHFLFAKSFEATFSRYIIPISL